MSGFFGDLVLLAVVAIAVIPVASARVEEAVNWVRWQGIILGLAFLASADTWERAVVAVAILLTYVLGLPALTRRILRQSRYNRESPESGTAGALLGAGLLVTLAFAVGWSSGALDTRADLLLPTALALVLLGVQRTLRRRRTAGQSAGLLQIATGTLLASLPAADAAPTLPILALILLLIAAFAGSAAADAQLDRDPGSRESP